MNIKPFSYYMKILGIVTFVAASILLPLRVPFASTSVERISRDHDGDWHFTKRAGCGSRSATTGTATFEIGPAGAVAAPDATPSPGVTPSPDASPQSAPPKGQGSIEFRTGTNGDSEVFFRTDLFAGKRLIDLKNLSYWSYVDPESALPVPDPLTALTRQVSTFIRIAVTNAGVDGGIDYLTFEPAYQVMGGQDPVARGTWQSWRAHDETGRWWLASTGDGTYRTLAEWLQTYPGASIAVGPAPDQGGFLIGVGCGGPVWANFVGNVDDVRIDFADQERNYDFELAFPTDPTRLSCNPRSRVLPSGTSHLISCVARDELDRAAEKVELDVEIRGANDTDGMTPAAPDLSCTTDSEGRCTFRHGPQGTGTTKSAGPTTYTIWIDEDRENATTELDRHEALGLAGSRPEPDDTDVTSVAWGASRLSCDPETVNLPPGSSNEIVCRAADATDAGVSGAHIDIEIVGAHDPDGSPAESPHTPDLSCITGTGGTCSLSHASPKTLVGTGSSETSTYRAWIDLDERNESVEADPSEGIDEAASPGRQSEQDATEVLQATWHAGKASPSPTETTSSPSPTTSSTSTPSPGSSSSPEPSPSPSQTLNPNPRECTIFGSDVSEILYGTSGGDVICAGDGNDEIYGLGGSDVILAGGGNDQIVAGPGRDIVSAGRGADVVKGSSGHDVLLGGRGGDRLQGSAGRDDIKGGRGHDRLSGGRGSDSIAGGKGRDKCLGRSDLRSKCEVF